MKNSLDWKTVTKFLFVSLLLSFLTYAFISLDKPTPEIATIVTAGTFLFSFLFLCGGFRYLEGDFDVVKGDSHENKYTDDFTIHEILWFDQLKLRPYNPADRTEIYKGVLLRSKNNHVHLVVSPTVFDYGFDSHYHILIEYGEKMEWWTRREIFAAGYDVEYDHKRVIQEFIPGQGVEVLGGMTVKGNGSGDLGGTSAEWWREVQQALFGPQ